MDFVDPEIEFVDCGGHQVDDGGEEFLNCSAYQNGSLQMVGFPCGFPLTQSKGGAPSDEKTYISHLLRTNQPLLLVGRSWILPPTVRERVGCSGDCCVRAGSQVDRLQCGPHRTTGMTEIGPHWATRFIPVALYVCHAIALRHAEMLLQHYLRCSLLLAYTEPAQCMNQAAGSWLSRCLLWHRVRLTLVPNKPLGWSCFSHGVPQPVRQALCLMGLSLKPHARQRYWLRTKLQGPHLDSFRV